MQKTQLSLNEALTMPTISVPDAGRLFYGLTVNGSYEAVKQKLIPTIKVGRRRMMVPVAKLADSLGLKANIGGV